MRKKDSSTVGTKTICHFDFSHVDSQYPCFRSVCECHELYKKNLASNRARRRSAKETAANE
jgi:hypothetical protein